MSTAPAAAPISSVKIPAGTTAGAADPGGRPADQRSAGHRRRPRRARPAAGPGLGARARTTEAEPVPADTEDGRSVIRHSAAHVLAQAVQQAFPDAKLGIGPPIRDGFYYDFDVGRALHPGGSGRPRQAHAQDHQVRSAVLPAGGRRRSTTPRPSWRPSRTSWNWSTSSPRSPAAGDAEESVEVGAGELTIYDNLHAHTGERVWGDLCRGPHVPTTRYIPAFKLTRSAAAYWRGNQDNPQLQRIYGTAWESAEALDAYLERLAEAERRDHRKLGTELDLFSFPDEIGSGLAVFHPQGRHPAPGAGGLRPAAAHRRGLRLRQHPAHHQGRAVPHLRAPALLRGRHVPADARWRSSRYYLKADELPDAQPDLPVPRPLLPRAAAAVLRVRHACTAYEKSGVVHGLTRVRGMTQDDSHILLHPRAGAGRDRQACCGSSSACSPTSAWTTSTWSCRPETRCRTSSSAPTRSGRWPPPCWNGWPPNPGWSWSPTRAAPPSTGRRSPSSAGTRIGRTWQMSTIQYDFNQPARFGLEYQAADGTRQQPVMIHSAKFGSIERFIGVLTEHYAGAFPAWLAPVQVVGIPVADAFGDHLEAVNRELRGRGIRAEVDHSDDRMQKKIRTHTTGKVPFLLLAGEKDVERGGGVVPVPGRHPDQRRAGRRRRSTRSTAGSRSRSNTSPTAEEFADLVPPVDRRGAPGLTRGGGWLTSRNWCRRTGSAFPTTCNGCGRRTGWRTSPAVRATDRTQPTTIAEPGKRSARSAGSRRCPTRTG